MGWSIGIRGSEGKCVVMYWDTVKYGVMYGDAGRFGKYGVMYRDAGRFGKYVVMYGDTGRFGKCGVMY